MQHLTDSPTKAWTWKALDTLTGGLSAPSKMEGPSWSISALECKLGSILRKKAGSTCSGCYALKGRYVFPSVKAAHSRRLAAYNRDPSTWALAMGASIRKHKKGRLFRWFDAGDLQSLAMLEAIIGVVRATPGTQHWLPTRERSIVRSWISKHPEGLPMNLALRISAPMVGSAGEAVAGTVRSMVHLPEEGPSRFAFSCEASARGGKCGPCVACYSPEVALVSYPRH